MRSEPNTEMGLIEMPECSRISEPSSSEMKRIRSFASSESTSYSMPA